MVSESVKAELDKLDKLQEEFERTMEVYQAHVRTNRFDLLREDNKAWKAAEKAWQEQIKKVYPNCIFGYDKVAETVTHQNRNQLQDKLETLTAEFTSEPELEVLEEPDDLENDFTAAEARWSQFTTETQLKASLDQLARGWGKYPEGSTKNKYEGDYIINIYKHGRRVQSFPVTAYELDSDIPLEETVEVRVKPTWGDCFKRCTTLTGESVVLTNAKTKEIVLRLYPNEGTPVIDSFGQTIGDAGRACFMDGTRIQFTLPISADVYGGMMSIEYATMYAQRRMSDEIYWHTLHEIITLYALGCISQYEYFFLRRQSQIMRNQKKGRVGENGIAKKMRNDADPTYRGREMDQIEAETRKLAELEEAHKRAFHHFLSCIASEPPHMWGEAKKAWIETEKAWRKQLNKVCLLTGRS